MFLLHQQVSLLLLPTTCVYSTEAAAIIYTADHILSIYTVFWIYICAIIHWIFSFILDLYSEFI